MRRSVSLAYALLALLAAQPFAGGAGASTLSEADAWLPRDVGADAIVGFPLYAGGQNGLALLVLAQLERQGILGDGAIDALAAAAEPPLPPAIVYRDLHPACDLDGDGLEDAFVNDLTLSQPPSHGRATSRVSALAGETGEPIWTVDNLVYTRPSPAGLVASGRSGAAFPGSAENVAPMTDANGDGVCDVFAMGMDTSTGFSTVLLGDPSVTYMPFSVRALSGVDGSEIWRVDLEATIASQSDLFNAHQVLVVRDVPSGMVVTEAADGPRVVLKTTDLEYVSARWPLMTPPIPYIPPVFRSSISYDSVTVTDRIRSYGPDGALAWTRDLDTARDAQHTNLTWLAGVADVDMDGEPEVALDQLTISNPRGPELNTPGSSTALYRYGRGMSVTLLDGATGATEWAAPLLAPGYVEPNPPQEESFETISFTHARFVPDVTGDGAPDVLASYLAQEEQLSASVAGTFRTHVIPISGVDGTALWDVKQQGWGQATTLDGGDGEPATLIGLGMVDVPTGNDGFRRFPQKFVRLVALQAADGAVAWSYERAFTQNSWLSYNLALAQYERSLAPVDVDGDGVRDMLTPSQYAPPTGRDQVLLATSSHVYEARSGRDGRVVGEIRAWGPDGRVVDCGASPYVTVLSGHGRRLDLTRFDPATGETLWRHPVHNDPAPRAAVSGIDITGLGVSCADRADGSTLFSVNLQAFSFDRRHEVVPVIGLVRAATVSWVEPDVRGEPTTSIILAGTTIDEPAPPFPWLEMGVGAAVGAIAAVLTVALLSRLRGGALLGIGMVLLVLAAPIGPALGGLPALDAPTDSAPFVGAEKGPDRAALAAEVASLGQDATPRDLVDAVARFLAAAGYPVPAPENDTLAGFELNNTLTFTHEAGDIDGDGEEDLLFDQYCINFSGCATPVRLPDDAVRWGTSSICDWTHQLYAVSGRTGEPLWRLDMNERVTLAQCGQNFVLGTAPLGNGTGLLVYKYVGDLAPLGGVGPGVFLVTHTLEMIDARTGEIAWTWTDTGQAATDWTTAVVARSLVVLPLLLAPAEPMMGLPAMEPSLLLQGIGFDLAVASTVFGDPTPVGLFGPFLLVDHYGPQEWAARVDLATGAESWRVDTFLPEPGLSVIPKAVDDHHALGDTLALARTYNWGGRGCCLDATGDGVPDLLYRTLRYTSTPNANAEGPYDLDVWLRLYDGASGAMVAETQVQDELKTGRAGSNHARMVPVLDASVGFAYAIGATPLGDVDGDGALDLLLEEQVFVSDYVHRFTVRSGATLEPIWGFDSPRDLRAVPLGDANGDGAGDLLLVDWYGYENGANMPDEYVTPAETPLRALSGRDGAELWRVSTYQAPIDVVLYFDTLLRNGLPDVDGDGVADVVVDDPQYLGDQSVIHEMRMVSGRDASTLYSMRAVGAFAVPGRVPDVGGDGTDEIVVLSGDLNDLWMTLHDGATGTPQWSRRVLALPSSGYAQALPFLRFHTLDAASGVGGVALNMHLETMRAYAYSSTCVGCDGTSYVAQERWSVTTSTTPQAMRADGGTGRLGWAVPALEDFRLESSVLGATPGTQGYDELVAAASITALDEAREAAPKTLPVLAAFLAAYLVVGAIGVAIVRARARSQEVPDLV